MADLLLPRPIFVVSDATGETAETVVRAGLRQYQGYLVHIQVFPNVAEREQLEKLVRLCAAEHGLLVTTLVRPDMRRAAEELAKEHRIRTVDLIGNLLGHMAGFLQAQPDNVPGRLHTADEGYFRRIDAIEYTVKVDDGKEPRMLDNADIVLLGVSRTSKTPLSVFLAHKGYKVGNQPIVLDRPLPDRLYEIDQRRVFALTIDPEALREIRRQRVETMRFPGKSNYSDMNYILAELEWSEDLFRRNPTWPVIDVTNKAVEETAATILKVMYERGLGLERGEVGQLG